MQPMAVVVAHARFPARMLFRRQVRYLHMDRLHLLVLRRDGAEPIAHLVTGQRHVLALDAVAMETETEGLL